jgi:hypothetical protein
VADEVGIAGEDEPADPPATDQALAAWFEVAELAAESACKAAESA